MESVRAGTNRWFLWIETTIRTLLDPWGTYRLQTEAAFVLSSFLGNIFWTSKESMKMKLMEQFSISDKPGMHKRRIIVKESYKKLTKERSSLSASVSTESFFILRRFPSIISSQFWSWQWRLTLNAHLWMLICVTIKASSGRISPGTTWSTFPSGIELGNWEKHRKQNRWLSSSREI